MRPHPAPDGFTLIELMVALVLLSVVSLGLTTTLVSAHRALATSSQAMHAAQLAAAALEELRAGQVPESEDHDGDFRRSVSVVAWPGHSSLRRLEVTVSWDNGAHTLQLVTLARR